MDTGDAVVEVESVSKAYRMYAHPRHRLLEALWRGRRRYHVEFWALREVSLRCRRGATVGLIGRNGSGKSTLLQIVAGILQPSAGRVTVRGRVASLLELGAGFDPEFTGRDNVIMQASIAGIPPEETRARLPAIEAFAEIGDFIDQPVKTYSSGMFVRLAFAAAIHVDPEVLLVDEALAVGDAIFQHRCIRRLRELQEFGVTILFVSHDTALVKSLCTEAILLEGGRVHATGPPGEVAMLYHELIATLEGRRPSASPLGKAPASGPASALYRSDPEFERRAGLFRHGSGAARLRNVEILDARGRPSLALEFGQPMTLRVHLEFLEDVAACILGFYIRDRNGYDLIGTNTAEEGVPIPPCKAGHTLVVDFRHQMLLQPATYSITSALAYNRHTASYLDWIDNALVFQALPPSADRAIHGKVGIPVDIVVHE